MAPVDRTASPVHPKRIGKGAAHRDRIRHGILQNANHGLAFIVPESDN